MGTFFREERGFISFFALCFLGASVLMATGLLYMARQGADAIRHYEREMQLRFDAEGFLERAANDIETGKINVAEELPGHRETTLRTGKNEQGILLKVVAKKGDTGLFLVSIAEEPTGNTALFKTAQIYMARRKEGYAWKCWLH